MKLNEMSSSVDVKTNIPMKTFKAELSQDKLHKMWDLLQSPYRDPISSLIREYASNAFDSHIEANVDTPVYITLEEDQSGWYWACEDFGVGISEDRAQNIFMKYLNSTKEETNDQIGAFGMGSKSGLGYTDIVHIRTRYDGTEYNYMLHKTTDAPTLSQINAISTDKGNGTQIKVYLKDASSESHDFRNKTKTQLDYFENIVYGGELKFLNKDFEIFQHENFCYKPDNNYNELHILIGKVAYPIDWKLIGEDGIVESITESNSPLNKSLSLSKVNELPIALNFNIGDLPVIFTREDIRYTDTAVGIIKKKYIAAIKEIIDLTTPISENFTDLEKYLEKYLNKLSISFVGKTNTYKLEIPNVLTNLIPTTNSVYTPNPYIKRTITTELLRSNVGSEVNKVIEKLFQFTLTYNREIKNGKNYSVSHWGSTYKYNYTQWKPNKNSYYNSILMDEESNPRKNRYISQKFQCYSKLLKDNRGRLKLIDYKEILKLKGTPKESWRAQIKWYQDFQNENFDKFYQFKYSEVEVPDEFERNAVVSKTRRILGTDEVRARFLRERETTKWGNMQEHHVTSDLEVTTIDKLKNDRATFIWGNREEESGLIYTYRLLKNFQMTHNNKIISIAKKDIELFEILSEENDNIINITDWYSTDNELLECFVFFKKFGKLVEGFNKSSVLVKPKNVPYQKYYSFLYQFNKRLIPEFEDHLVKIFKLNNYTLNLNRINNLRVFYEIDTFLGKKCKELIGSSTMGYNTLAPILACEFYPNYPLNGEFKRVKNNYLILKSNK